MGSIKMRILIIVLIILAVVGASYLITNIYQTNNAKTFGDSFVATIKDQNNDQGYAMLSTNFKDLMGSNFSWSLWSSTVKKANQAIPETSNRINREGLNLIEPKFILLYDIGNNSNLRVNIEYKNNIWQITNCAILKQ